MRVPQPGDVLGRYRVDREIGRGGMGVVFAATDTRLGRTVALKVITGPLVADPEFLQRFQSEASVLSALDSPHVIGIHDHDTVDGLPFIVTQYVDGPDLASWLTEHGALPPAEALTICAQVARALADAHRNGVVHRDVKPANVLLRAPGTPEVHAYLGDFGIARADTTSRTATGMVAGSWAYLAPERTQGAPASVSTDLYALGCVLWECLTGSPAFRGSDVEVAIAQVQAPVPQLAASAPLAAEINPVLARLLAKDPDARYPDASAARADLERVAAGGPPAGGPPGPPPGPWPDRHREPTRPAAPPPPPARRRGRRIAVGAAALGTLVLLGGAATWAGLRAGADDAPPKDDGAEPADAVQGDLDGDGYGDVMAIERRWVGINGVLWTSLSTGGAFEESAPTTVELGEPDLGDVDGDGLPEQVWLGAPSEPDVSYVRVVTGTGELWHERITFTGEDADGFSTELVGDVTGDGRADVVVQKDGVETDGLYVAASNGDGFDAPVRWYSGDISPDVDAWTVGDFDGDGDDDVLLVTLDVDEDTRQLQVYESRDEEFVLGEPTVLPDRVWGHASWLAGDVDGDGADELVAVDGLGGQVGTLDLVDGSFGQPETAWPGEYTPQEWRERLASLDDRLAVDRYALSDVDGDGDTDLIRFEGELPTTLAVFRAEDGAFADSEPWGELSCLKCKALPRMVD